MILFNPINNECQLPIQYMPGLQRCNAILICAESGVIFFSQIGGEYSILTIGYMR